MQYNALYNALDLSIGELCGREEVSWRSEVFEAEAINCCLGFLKEWQTLIAGLLALAAAVVTISLLRRQIRQSDQHAEEVRFRRSRAARATMPAALSSLIEYIEGCALYAAELRRIGGLGHSEWATQVQESEVSMPEYPNGVVQALRDCVEHAEAGPTDAIAKLLGELQVLVARLRGLQSRIEGRRPRGSVLVGAADNAQVYVIQAANIYAMTEKLFPYARRESEDTPDAVNGADVARALRLMSFDDSAYPEFFQEVQD